MESLPADILCLILSDAAVPDVLVLSRVSRRLRAASQLRHVWLAHLRRYPTVSNRLSFRRCLSVNDIKDVVLRLEKIIPCSFPHSPRPLREHCTLIHPYNKPNQMIRALVLFPGGHFLLASNGYKFLLFHTAHPDRAPYEASHVNSRTRKWYLHLMEAQTEPGGDSAIVCTVSSRGISGDMSSRVSVHRITFREHVLSATLVYEVDHDCTIAAISLDGPWLAYGGKGSRIHVVNCTKKNLALTAVYPRFPAVLGLKLLYPHLLAVYNSEVKLFIFPDDDSLEPVTPSPQLDINTGLAKLRLHQPCFFSSAGRSHDGIPFPVFLTWYWKRIRFHSRPNAHACDTVRDYLYPAHAAVPYEKYFDLVGYDGQAVIRVFASTGGPSQIAASEFPVGGSATRFRNALPPAGTFPFSLGVIEPPLITFDNTVTPKLYGMTSENIIWVLDY